jgi:hypothetical protein
VQASGKAPHPAQAAYYVLDKPDGK